MGVIMCSKVCNGGREGIPSHQFTETWHSSEGEIDDEEVVESFSFSKSKSLPGDLDKKLNKMVSTPRAKTERMSRVSGYSLTERLKERSRSSVVSREGEACAKKYSKMVRDDTLKHINHSLNVADSIVQKTANINDELGRQERVLRTVEADMSDIEFDTDVTSHTLKGMTSLKAKIASKISRKKPKRKSKEKKINIDLFNGQPGLLAFSRMVNNCESDSLTGTESSGYDPDEQIKAGLGQLNKTLDIIKSQQFDTAWALDRQEGRFSVLEDKMDTSREKITCQSQLMKKIMSK
jgi:hypothetical protein